MGAPLVYAVRHKIVAVAVADEGAFGSVQPGQLPTLCLRHYGATGCEPMDAQLALQEGEDAVHRTTPGTAPDEQVVPHGPVSKALVVPLGFLRSRQGCHALVIAHTDAPARCLQVGADGQPGSAHLLDVLLQFAGSRLLRSGSICGNDNRIVRLAVAEEPIGSTDPRCQEQKGTSHDKPAQGEDICFHWRKDRKNNSKFKINKFKFQIMYVH